ncbi:late competence development ComFB family protein [Caminicella sporogenes]|uniref:late competence development ComFB family protein n=1 Tax=Caminicella sporogenes TaxID=166485 RepID=UPI002540B388|nr:late competence development ComFB family protein [Caminicella sporogenes]WIF94524.1 late competence development ComFB family protein [Caminicella sporogenes]
MKIFLKNYMEVVIDRILPELLSGFEDICKCEKCQMDIKAIALNNLKPHYIVSEKGRLYEKVYEMDMQFCVDVMKALINAIDIVSKNPRH